MTSSVGPVFVVHRGAMILMMRMSDGGSYFAATSPRRSAVRRGSIMARAKDTPTALVSKP